MKYAHLALTHLTKAAYVMDEVYTLPTDTKLVQVIEKELSNVA